MNIPLVLRLIGVTLFLAILPIPGHALTPAEVFDKVKDAIVVVKTLDDQGKLKAQGSGVVVSTGRVATNCHVIEEGASYQVGRGKQLVSATLYAEDEDKDICLLDVKGIEGEPAQLGRAAALKVGDPVFAVGAPKGLELSLSDGIVAQLRGGPPPLIQTTAAISPGSSGGGLFDGEGRLVGLTALYIEGGQSLNFAMPVEWITEIKPGRKEAAGGRGQTDWIEHAIALGDMKNWRGLLDWCQKWTKSEPESAMAWNDLGVSYRKLKRYEDAIEAYRQALKINLEYAEAWYNLGLVYGDLNRYQDAIEATRKALRINPEDAEFWLELGASYHTLNRYQEAIEAYRQALKINPEYVSVWYNLGNVYHELNRHNDAIEAYRQAVRINPEYAKAWNNLGVSCGNLKRYEDAIEAFRQAVRIDPEDAKAWYGLGIVYGLSGNKTAAMDAVRQLRRFNPELADKLFNLIVPR